MEFEGFDWDEGNWPKCGKHGVSRAEIEVLLTSNATLVFEDRSHSGLEDRFLAVGRHHQSQRGMIVGFTYRFVDDQRLIRPVTARFMHAKEVTKYERFRP